MDHAAELYRFDNHKMTESDTNFYVNKRYMYV